jgi:hypothetical protein
LQISDFTQTNWQKIESFDGISLIHTMTTVDDQIASYNKYRFRIKAVNDYGSSEWSSTIDVAIAPKPSAPEPAVKLQNLST